MLEACDRLGVLVMDETFDMWTQPKSEDDYALRFPDWWEADVEAMVRKDFNHPSVILYSIGNEIPEAGTPMGARVGRALAEKIRSLDSTRFVTEAISGLLVGGAELFAQLAEGRRSAVEEPDEETGVNTAMTQIADRLNDLMNAPVVAKNSAQTASYLDVVGYNYMESRFGIDGELYPNRVIVGQRDAPRGNRHGLGGGPPAPVRDRRLHLDRVGLPRRGRDRAHRLRPAGWNARDPVIPGRVPLAHGVVWRHRHHGPPSPAVVLPRDRLRSADGPLPRRAAARAPRCGGRRRRRGPGPTWSRAGVGPGTRARRSRSRSTPTRTRSSCW